jgi:hypothetical protein
MAPDRRRLAVLLGVLVIAGVVAIVRYWPESAAARSAQASGGPGRRGTAAARIAAPDVHLRALTEQKPQPDTGVERDLFRFKPKAAPRREIMPMPAAVSAPPPGPPAAPSIPPIALRFIGLVEAPGQSQRIAILSDSRGIYQGVEGAIIEGRYRILRIGVESIDLAYVDGTGRQTIRLSGS